MRIKKLYELELRRRRLDVDLPPTCRMADDAASLAREVIGDAAVEIVIALYLDGRNRVIGYAEIARGGSNAVHVTPVDVLRPALLAGAVALILAHNHPSGDVTPSSEDHALTTRMLEACRLVNVPMLDHVIVSDERFFSFQSSTTLLRA